MKDKKELLTREMSRKEFLQFGVIVVLSLLGISNFINMIQNNKIPSPYKSGKGQPSRGFGSSKFGE